jgi:hypothetical protein
MEDFCSSARVLVFWTLQKAKRSSAPESRDKKTARAKMNHESKRKVRTPVFGTTTSSILALDYLHRVCLDEVLRQIVAKT